MKIALIGNDYTQQFPLMDYGGIETCVQNLAYGMHIEKLDFFVVIPKRLHVNTEYNFPIFETEELPTSVSKKNPIYFCQQAKKIIQNNLPDIIWSQSNWSIDVLKDLNIPIISTFHDSCEKQPDWIKPYKHVYYRFISKFQYNNWIDSSEEKKYSFRCYTGIQDEEYEFHDSKDTKKYFLWCAGLQWGMSAKGLDTFIELANSNPKENFFAYGSGNDNLITTITQYEKTIPNFKFFGPLQRGKLHNKVFGEAKALIMPTKIPDTFPRTCLEAISKGTPIIGSTLGSLPEIIGDNCGIICNSLNDYNVAINTINNFDRNNIFQESKKYCIANEVKELLYHSNRLINDKT